MTAIESYYLMLCLAAFAVFACALGYNAMSWKSWNGQRTAPAREQNAKASMREKIAA
ncbi:hypothetical protein [Hyphomicrobium sp.]|uniref:hypothetical protein n=1 Tax=Hyphomicrobium sp. TaxID=82 RepID=UPI0025C231B0|nr:hypothetical protein [Hyphomicrobium sp.]